jgi:predicted dehydrogenase
LRVGVLGAARVVPQALLGPARATPGVVVEAIAARGVERARAFGRATGIPKAVGSYEDLIADDGIDAVYVALPTALHARWVRAALEAGKHVLCEKPLAATAAVARELAATARKRGRVLQEAMQVVYLAPLRRAAELVREGRVGRPVRGESCFRIPRVPMAPGDFRLSYELGGGAGLDLGCYAAACLRLVMGEEPELLSARARRAGPGVDRWMRGECAFPSGASGRVECGFRGFYRRRLGVRITCERGWIDWSEGGVSYRVDGKVVREDVPVLSPHAIQLAEFVKRCRGEQSEARSLEDSVATLVVVDAMYERAGLPTRPNAGFPV